jgi:HSP20 family protein
MPWDPTRDLLTMQERLESLFGRAAPGWVPAVDLFEQPDRYVLTVELPGMRREDVRIDTQGETVIVSGQRPGQTCCPERYQQLERGQGHFSRSFRFALPISSDDVVAELVLGVLTVSIPKRQPAGVRIDVT